MDGLLNDITLTYATIIMLAAPLLGFIINGFWGKQLKMMSGWIASGVMLIAFACSAYLFLKSNADTSVEVQLADWISFAGIHIPFAFLIDPLSIIMTLIVTGVGFLIHIYSIGYMHDDEAYPRFFTYLNLFIFFMLTLVCGNNYLVMFIGWEGVGLCSYLLIGFWFKNNAYNNAAKKAFIMNRIGDLGFLIALFFMLFYFRTLEFKPLFAHVEMYQPNSIILVSITLLLFVGAMGKSAQIPLYTWLPDAMAGPTPVSALIHAATMVTAGVYMIVRSHVLYTLAPHTQDVVLIVGIATSLFAAIIGLKQNDIKKVLAYSTVSQLGLMFVALGLGAYSSGLFHVMTHAFFKALLFLGAGSVIHAMGGEQDIRRMGGLKGPIKITFITFLIGSLAISGIFPLAGFFSKDEILAHAFEHNTIIWILASISSMMTAFYMFRLVYLTFYNDFRGSDAQKHHLHESPAVMTFPLIVLALLSIVGGWVGMPEVFGTKHFLGDYLSQVLNGPITPVTTESHSNEWLLMGIATVAAIASIALAYGMYVSKKTLPEEDAETKGIAALVANKFYVDEFYNTIIVRPIMVLSDVFLVVIDKLIIDLVMTLIGWIVYYFGRLLRLFQTGNTGFYLTAMVISMVIFLAIQILF